MLKFDIRKMEMRSICLTLLPKQTKENHRKNVCPAKQGILSITIS